MRFPSLHKLHAQKYKTSLSHRFMQCNGKPGRWVIFHIPFFAVSARGATYPGYFTLPLFLFQFTPLQEGRLTDSVFHSQVNLFQFTPLREGRPRKKPVEGVNHISIHAPARGATKLGKLLVAGEVISIHAPARGATLLEKFKDMKFQFTPLREGRPNLGENSNRLENFNSRPCERGDARRPARRMSTISIHAPARGATSTGRLLLD